MHKIKTLAITAAGFLMPAAAWAQSLALTEVAGNGNLTTIFVPGDPRVVASAFNGIASFFSGGGAIGDTFMGGLIGVSVLISLAFFLFGVLLKQKFEGGAYLLSLCVGMALFLPRTTVYVVSYFDASGGGAGATRFEAVDNVPIGVAYPLGIMSAIAEKMTMRYDSFAGGANLTTGCDVSTNCAGGFMARGLEGYFSPLKTMLRLREIPAPPDVQGNMTNYMNSCNGRGRLPLLEKGLNAYFTSKDMPFSGMADITFTGSDGLIRTEKWDCYASSGFVYLQMMKYLDPNGTASQAVRELMRGSATSQAQGQSTAAMNRLSATQNELDNAFKTFASAARLEVPEASGAWTQAYNAVVASANAQATMRNYMASFAMDSSAMQANLMYGPLVRQCANDPALACKQFAYSMRDAVTQSTVNAAGGAGVYTLFLTHGANIMIYIFVIMSPLILVVGLIMGMGGLKIWGGFLLFAAWIYSWLPISGAISYYMLYNFSLRIKELGDAINAAATGGGSTALEMLINPQAMQEFHDQTVIMLGNASTAMASAPLISMALMTGSIFGLVSLAQRMSPSDHFNEKAVAPDLATSKSLGADAAIAAKGTTGAVPMTNIGATPEDAALTSSLKIQESDQNAVTAASAIQKRVEEAQAQQSQATAAIAKANGWQSATFDGHGFNYTDSDGTSKKISFAEAQAAAAKTSAALNGGFAIPGGPLKGGAQGGASGERTDSVNGSTGSETVTGTNTGEAGQSGNIFTESNSLMSTFSNLQSASRSLSAARAEAQSFEKSYGVQNSAANTVELKTVDLANFIGNNKIAAGNALNEAATQSPAFAQTLRDIGNNGGATADSQMARHVMNTLGPGSNATREEKAAAYAFIGGVAAGGQASGLAAAARGEVAEQRMYGALEKAGVGLDVNPATTASQGLQAVPQATTASPSMPSIRSLPGGGSGGGGMPPQKAAILEKNKDLAERIKTKNETHQAQIENGKKDVGERTATGEAGKAVDRAVFGGLPKDLPDLGSPL